MWKNGAQERARYVPIIRDVRVRSAIGFILLVISEVFVLTIFANEPVKVFFAVIVTTLAWGVALFFTDKYRHKYPQRYFSYLIASHSKAAVIMVACVLIVLGSGDGFGISSDILWAILTLFIVLDFFVSLPCRRATEDHKVVFDGDESSGTNVGSSESENLGLCSIDKQAVISQIPSECGAAVREFISVNLPDLEGGLREVLVLDEKGISKRCSTAPSAGLVISRDRINDVQRLSHFLILCANEIVMGGYFVIWYTPIENVINDLKNRYSGLFYWLVLIVYFVWYRIFPKLPLLNRLRFTSKCLSLDPLNLSATKRRCWMLSKAEMWGRLAYSGMQVIAETKGLGVHYVMAQRIAKPDLSKRPSYYILVGLEKVGLEGKIIRTHKIRTMFPYSEFIQKRLFEDHGLATTGKIANDFRLTGYGKVIRKYWLDELPQIFDWLRGDIKLVGIRATSRHFLSLYPKEFLDLYFQIKPGLIPPVFDESTSGFDQIVAVELAYLRQYWRQPFQTDVRCLVQTFTDIVFRGIRSK